MSSAFANGYQSGPSGANYAKMTESEEDNIFFLGAKHTQWKPKWMKYTPHHSSMIVQPLSNQGLGNNMTCNMIKTPDFLYSSYVQQFYPAIKANTEMSIQDCSWVNAPALFAIKSIALKIGSQTMFQLNGTTMMVLLELYGKLGQYAKMIGLCKTRAQLKAESKRDRVLYAPLIGMPFQDRPDQAFPTGSIAFHGLTMEMVSKSLQEMVINYGAINPKKGYAFALPIQISTGGVLQNNSVQFQLATNCVWVSPDERVSLVHGYNECMFREVKCIGEHSVGACTTSQRIALELNVKGPVCYIAVTIQSRDDLQSGNWTKLCQDSGEDYISECMLITGSTPREDGLTPEFYRTGKIVEAFKTKIDRHVYVISFETDAHSRQMTGHQNMTNAETVKFSALFKPHSAPLEVTAICQEYNGWYTNKGTGGVVYG